MCIRGASEIETKVLEQIKDPNIRVYAVYLPMLRGDAADTVPAAMDELPDERVSFFWDANGKQAQTYAPVLQLPKGQVAWDVYLLFNKDAEWKDQPPGPDYWMHQLGGVAPERRLNGKPFADETNKLLQANK
jgi:hypothetical protein